MSAIGPGDLVVCVDARLNPTISKPTPLHEGRVYRVASVRREAEPHALYGSTVGLFLVGLRSGGATGAFAINRFRKLNDGNDDAKLIARIKQCRPVRQGEMA